MNPALPTVTSSLLINCAVNPTHIAQIEGHIRLDLKDTLTYLNIVIQRSAVCALQLVNFPHDIHAADSFGGFKQSLHIHLNSLSLR